MHEPSSDADRPDLDAAHALPLVRLCEVLGADVERGLSTSEARRRLASFGPNELATSTPIPVWRRLLSQFEAPLVLLLIAATAISFLVWALERETALPYEALTILVIVIANALLGHFQEQRAEAAIAGLRKLTPARTTVVRDGAQVVIAAAAVVPGDLLLLDEGASVPADARVAVSVSMHAMEAALTGESAPVAKDPAPLARDAALADRSNMVFAGTAIGFGHGRAVVTATGMQAEIGRIAGLLTQTEIEKTPLQAELDRTGRVLGVVVLAIAGLVGATLLLIQRDLSLPALAAILLYTVALAVAAVPEGLSMITTVVLSLGVQRMAVRNVIVRRLSAVETLGAATVVCTDKTGTLTRNEMTVRTLVTAGGRVDFTGAGYDVRGDLLHGDQPLAAGAFRDEIERALAAGWLSNNAELVVGDGKTTILGDPTEAALKVAAIKAGLVPARLHARFARIGEIPFSSERKLMSTAHADAEKDGGTVLLVKGAPDVLLARCHAEQVGTAAHPLDPVRREEIHRSIEGLAGEALRTLGLARREFEPGPEAALHPDAESELVWLGVIGLLDPPRPEAAQAVRVARDAGVRVIMITGDHPRLATAIARELDIAGETERTITGVELDTMTDEALSNAVQAVSVYARVNPLHKLRIVHALKRNGEVVAMTGDGVNDAPALRAADIGVAMGITGTDVARGASDMVLADDNFASIVAAIEEGRSIYSNIQKYLRYLLATNLGEVGVLFLGVVGAGWLGVVAGAGALLTLPLTATMILWVNLVTDAGPALALGMDPTSARLMRRPPRDPASRIITRAMWRGIFLVAAVLTVGTLGVLDAALPGGLVAGGGQIDHARTLAFHTLVLFSLFAVFAARSDETSALHDVLSNRWLWLAVAASIALQCAVLYLAPLQRAFNTTPLSLRDWVISLAVASSVLWLRELSKLAARRARAGAVN
jgi:Ca2+-transporting ATPase